MDTPQQRWNQQHPKTIAQATKTWKSLQVRIEFFLTPSEAEPLRKLPGSRNANAKQFLLQALSRLA